MKQWRSNLARLNKKIKDHMLDNYKVIDYEVRKPSQRSNITWRPYGYHKWRRSTIARKRCIKYIQRLHKTIEVRSTTKKSKPIMHFDTDSYDILVDNCCSQSITNNLQDYIKPPKLSDMRIKGFNGNTTKTRVGTVRWRIHDDEGRIHCILLPNTYYSPHAESRLLSPQHWAQIAKNGRGTKCTTYHDAIILEWDNQKFKRTIPINHKTRNVGIITTPAGISEYLHECDKYEKEHQVIAFPTTIEKDVDLPVVTDDEEELDDHDKTSIVSEQPETKENAERSSPLQIGFDETQNDIIDEHPTFLDDVQEYMHWHYRLNHATNAIMIKLANKKMLPQRITQILKKMEKQRAKPPMCNDCYCASASRTPWRGKPKKDDKKMLDRRLKMKPGDVVSVDQLESSVPGLLGQMTGIPTTQRIRGSSVYVDQASDLSYIYHHTSLTSEDTVKGKEAFEAYAKSHGVHIKHYHADNGRFKDNAFLKSIQENHQTISFSGVGAHHQNGIAEKRIGDLQRRATTLLLHAQRRWPDAINSHLWTYAIRAANDCRNNAPTRKDDECPISRFCGTERVPAIKNQHHFGCPVYVLQQKIQNGRKARKWQDRTRIGINLGYSSRHAHSVSLVLSLQTGLVSPQFHCSYDDLFETTTGTQARSIPKSQWQYKVGFVKEPNKPTIMRAEQEVGNIPFNAEVIPPIVLTHPYEGGYEGDMDNAEINEEDNDSADEEDETSIADDAPAEQNVTPSPGEGEYVTRSGRISRPPERLQYTAFESLLEEYDYQDEDKWCETDLLAFKASTDPDTMYHHQAMREPDRNKFLKAMQDECTAHYKEGTYKLIKKADMPSGVPLLSSVWQMKRKRKPSTGEISKYKARLNVNGKEQVQGVHYEETYAPVVGWATIRFFMTLAIINNWHTRQLDFVLAFPQADIERELYMRLPAGFSIEGLNLTEEEKKEHVLRLDKNLYGQKQAGRVWYQHLRKNLIKLGFKPSEHDECVFYHGTTIFIVYTDDTILLGPDKKEIESIYKKLDAAFKIEDQGDLSDYLGIKIVRNSDGTMEWSQPTLTNSILKDLGLVDVKTSNQPTTRTTPSLTTVILTSHDEEPNHDESKSFNYRQVIGKLLYLEKSTRPDIACAVHQCARFSANPKTKHAEAVKRIGRYLLATKDKGLIMKPDKSGLECWVDSAHASEWSNKTASNDPCTARSRMGYVISYAGCPMHWASKMQTEIALSTTEAEYIALSQSMREVLPIMWLLQEAHDHGIPVLTNPPKIHCKVFEDNAGAIEIAKVPKMRPRTKHLNIKYHHFREESRKGLSASTM